MRQFLLAVVLCGVFAWCSPASAGCLVRTFKDASGADRSLKVVVPDAEAADYGARGFQTATCGAIDIAAFRDEVCKLQTFGNTAVQKRIEEVFGASPTKMCASVTKVIAASTLTTPADDMPTATTADAPIATTTTVSATTPTSITTPAPSTCTGDSCAN